MQRNIARISPLLLSALLLTLVAPTADAEPTLDQPEDPTTITAPSEDADPDAGADSSTPLEADSCTKDCYREYKQCAMGQNYDCEQNLAECLGWC
ncbi:MAG: hypothetical protein KC431_19220 [Myxococcales bacterium]|nr:hypothetical protein [Myxococcales bacterium]